MHECILSDKKRNFEFSLSVGGKQMNVRELMAHHKLYIKHGMTTFKFAVGDNVGKGLVGDKAIWMPYGSGRGLKIVLKEEEVVDLPTMNLLQNTKSTVFPKINWVLEGKACGFPCIVFDMEDVSNVKCADDRQKVLNRCTNAFQSLQLLPEDEWYKSINLINGKIVDFHGFKTMPERYAFPHKCDRKVLEDLYDKGPRWHTRKKDLGDTTPKDTLYQGFRFAGGFELTGYSSNRKIFDSYRKLAYMPFRKMEGRRVLDIGCNQGFFTFQALTHGAKEIVALEYEAKHLDFAKQLNKTAFQSGQIQFIHGDANQYTENYKGKKFDVVIMLSVLHQMYPNLKGADKFLNRIAGMTNYFSFENPTNHPKMKLTARQTQKILQKHFRTVRHLYQYEAYSPGQRAIFICSN